nr:hypothetical protein [Micromonospora sp. DSM 115978]
IERSGLDPASPERNELSLRAFQITPAGDGTRLVALIDRQGRTLASIPGVPGIPEIPATPGTAAIPETSAIPGTTAPADPDTAGAGGADDAAAPVSRYQLGDAWEVAWSGRGAMSQVFTLHGHPGRALVAPVGSGPP